MKRIARKIDNEILRKIRSNLSVDSRVSVITFPRKQDFLLARRTLERKGIYVKYDLTLIGAYALEITPKALAELVQSEEISYIADDVRISSSMDKAAQHTGIHAVWKSGLIGRGIGIAILDTGVYPHVDLTAPVNRLTAFQDFIHGQRSPYDDNGHGTFAAGVAAGNGYASQGKYLGTAPGAHVIGVKVMNREGEGNASDVIAGMQWVVDHRTDYNIRIISLSLGTVPPPPTSLDALEMAAAAAWEKGLVVTAAAGNSGPRLGTLTTPGVCREIITVGAADDRQRSTKGLAAAPFSSRGLVGGQTLKPDILAPGVDIFSLDCDPAYKIGGDFSASRETYRMMSGTSVAAPMVAGAAALILEKWPWMTPNEIKSTLTRHAVLTSGSRIAQGSGIMDLGFLLKDV